LHAVEVGQSDTVLPLLHGSASTGAMWRQTMAALQSRYRVIAPDLIGYGRSPRWPADTPYGIDSEIRNAGQHACHGTGRRPSAPADARRQHDGCAASPSARAGRAPLELPVN